jgi:uncharacterized protein YjgD (DUF1641 family)
VTTTTVTPTIEDRLDQMALQLEVLTSEAMRQRAARERWSELTEVMTPIASQAMNTLAGELDDLDLSIDDVTRFARTLATTLPTLERLVGQLAPITELVEVITPMAKPVMASATDRLATLDERGYFDIGRSGLGIIDRVVTSFTDEDVEALGDNIVLILQTVREMTQPEVMQMLQRTFTTVQDGEHVEPTEPPGAFALLKEMRQPEVRRGLSKALNMLRSLGEESPGVEVVANSQTSDPTEK